MTRVIKERTPQQLREDALAIWTAGVRAVNGYRLVTEQLVIDDDWLGVPEQDLWIDLRRTRRILVAGAGKASAAMACGVAQVVSKGPAIRLAGHVQVPEEANLANELGQVVGAFDLRAALGGEGVTARLEPWLELHRVRPAGVNLVTAAAVAKSQELVEKFAALGPDDVCVFLLSGGASALLSSPLPGLSFENKNQVTRFLSSAGAPIEELNVVRSALSQIKAGGLARQCRAGQLLTLIISDVLGDPLESIGSGPTYVDGLKPEERAVRALEVLKTYDPCRQGVLRVVYESLQQTMGMKSDARDFRRSAGPFREGAFRECVILGNTATAVDAAGIEAERRGYSHAMHVQAPGKPEFGAPSHSAELAGQHWAELLSDMNRKPGPDCLITGGESVVDLTGSTGTSCGGRNQHLGLAALQHWQNTANSDWRRDEICFVSGGTDGEDGSTTVAGVCLSSELRERLANSSLDAATYLAQKNSYHFFRQVGGLLLTGPTQTNVCDLRVGVVKQPPASSTR
jgi:glycerate 2-kinase